MGIHQLGIGKGGGAAVVVDAQGDAAQQLLRVLRQQRGGGYIGTHNRLVSLRCGFCQALMEPAKAFGNFPVFQHKSGLSQLTQPQTQGGGGAGGIPVGAAVGQDQVVIVLRQKLGAFTPGQNLHRASPPES